MTMEQDPAFDETVQMPKPHLDDEGSEEELDPEKTIVRENWEEAVIRRVAPHVAIVQGATNDDFKEGRFGWESEGLRRLAQEVRRVAES